MPAIASTLSERKVTTEVMGRRRVDRRDIVGTVCEGREGRKEGVEGEKKREEGGEEGGEGVGWRWMNGME